MPEAAPLPPSWCGGAAELPPRTMPGGGYATARHGGLILQRSGGGPKPHPPAIKYPLGIYGELNHHDGRGRSPRPAWLFNYPLGS